MDTCRAEAERSGWKQDLASLNHPVHPNLQCIRKAQLKTQLPTVPLICPKSGERRRREPRRRSTKQSETSETRSDQRTGEDGSVAYLFKLWYHVFPAWVDIYSSGHVTDVVGDACGNSSEVGGSDWCFLSSEKITQGLIAWRCLCHSSSNKAEIINLMTDPVCPSSGPRPPPMANFSIQTQAET